MPKKVSLVMPVYNEVQIIEKVVREYYNKIINQLPGSEFIIAEDGSSDGTKEKLKMLERKIPLRLIMDSKRKGYPNSVRNCFKLPKNSIILFSDSDGQHDPNDYWKLMEKIDKCDIAIGYKKPRRDSFHRLFFSKGYNFLIGVLFGLWLRDIDSGFRVVNKRVIDDIIDDSTTLKECINSEITIRAFKKGYKICEVPVTHYPREFGDTKSFKFSKLPKVIIGLFVGLLKLRLELSKK